jgi:hypothetical protein
MEAYRILEKISGEIADHAPMPRSYGEAIRRVILETSQGQLGEEDLLNYASHQDIEAAIAALSLLSSVPTEEVDQFFITRQHEALLIICKAAGLTWQGARAILLLSHSGHGSLPEELEQLQNSFERLTISEVQEMLRLWRHHT